MSNSLGNPLDLILGRRSVRVFSPGAIPDSAVNQMLEAAMAAPSAMTKDPWRFVVVRRAETLAQLPGILPGGKMLSSATMAILIAGDQEAAFDQNLAYLLQDCSAAIQNLLLCAHGLGIGACWVGVYPGADSVSKVKDLFKLPGSMVPVAVVALGLPGEQLPPRTRFNPANVHHETW